MKYRHSYILLRIFSFIHILVRFELFYLFTLIYQGYFASNGKLHDCPQVSGVILTENGEGVGYLITKTEENTNRPL